MMAGATPPTRGLFAIIWKNIRKSFNTNKQSGNLVGQDTFGHKYFEIPADPQRGKRKPKRWFEEGNNNPLEKFDAEIPTEWGAWLRGTRENPPTEEEIRRNLGIMLMKQQASIKEQQEKPKEKVDNSESKPQFPTYSEYESIPGENPLDGKSK